MRMSAWNWFVRTGIAVGLVVVAHFADAAVSFTGGTYAQDFDALPNSGTNPLAWTNDSTLPGWSLFRRPAPGTALTSIRLSSGGDNTGSVYSFGAATGDAERALGSQGSNGAYWGTPATNSVGGWMALALVNDTDAAINTFTIAYDGEQWRNGGNASAQTMTLEYGFGASFDAVTWTAPGATFNFVSPITGTSAAALNGNDAANRIADLGGSVPDVAWEPDATLWVRWIEFNDASNDHGLALDNLEFTAGGGVVEPTNNSDFDNDLDVDGDDFLVWQRGLGLTGVPTNDKSTGDADGDGLVNDADLSVWQGHFGLPPAVGAAAAVPEPAALSLACIFALILGGRRRESAKSI